MARNQKKIFFLILVVLAAFSTILFFSFKSTKQNKAMVNFAQTMIPEVSVIKAFSENIAITKELPARVSAYEISEVRPEISGIIKQIKFQEGSFVRVNQQLYQIDSSVEKAEIEQAKANLKAAHAKAERFKKLLNIEGISKQEYEEVLSELALANAKFADAAQKLAETKVLAPISGIIGKTNFTVGALVTQNQELPLATITKLSPIYVDIVQPTSEAIKNRNNKNLKVGLLIDGQKYNDKGQLQFIQSFADESTDSVTLRAKFSNKDEKLIPGMFVTAKLYLSEYKAITVPQSAVNRDPNGNLSVFVVDSSNIATPRAIVADELYENKWIVKSGLVEGEAIIDKGLFKIRPNTEVKIRQQSSYQK